MSELETLIREAGRLGELERQLEESQRDATAARTEIEQLRRREKEHEQTNARVAELEAELDDSRRETDRLRRERQDAEAERTSLVAHQKRLERRVAELEAEGEDVPFEAPEIGSEITPGFVLAAARPGLCRAEGRVDGLKVSFDAPDLPALYDAIAAYKQHHASRKSGDVVAVRPEGDENEVRA
jgi:hypothetical protein